MKSLEVQKKYWGCRKKTPSLFSIVRCVRQGLW